mmetsp:Transcript_5012/g.7697  ORF Transcript_5012/g.7697 Transcript_5012/m.7697 type:complete len:130 (+) Transcript_5012:417-806(+)
MSDVSSSVEGTIEVNRLIPITEDYCRIRTTIKIPSGARLACVCGRCTTECNCHQKQRLHGKLRYPPGYYAACVSVENHTHGKCDTYMSPEDYKEWKSQEAETMHGDIEAQKDGDSVQEEKEAEALRQQN